MMPAALFISNRVPPVLLICELETLPRSNRSWFGSLNRVVRIGWCGHRPAVSSLSEKSKKSAGMFTR